MKIYLSHHFLTLSIALITRLISSFALLRVSALTALDILIKNDFFISLAGKNHIKEY